MTTKSHHGNELIIACTDAGDDPDDSVALALQSTLERLLASLKGLG